MKKFHAFTLAEILITLGIIGVVAAITLPTLIQNHQKQVYATQLQKSINILENMINKMKAEEGVNETSEIELFSRGICRDWQCLEISSNYVDLSFVEETVAKHLKTVKICKDSDCKISYTNQTYRTVGGNELNCFDSDPFSSYDKKIGFFTTDGSVFYFLLSSGSYQPLAIVIDINGNKEPNKFGRDVFSFYPFNWYTSWNNNKFEAGDACTARLMQNNFKMDY